jgi:protein arginine kinase activator
MASDIVDPVVCAQCGKRDAVVFIRRKVDAGRSSDAGGSGSSDLALCEICARSRGLVVGKGRIELRIGEIIDSALDDSRMGDTGDSMPEYCPGCGITLEQIRRNGRLGCYRCVDTYRPFLRRRVGGFSSRPGKEPPETEGREQKTAALPDASLTRLEKDLSEALRGEEYERAASIRDRIVELGAQPDSNVGKVDSISTPLAFPFGLPAFASAGLKNIRGRDSDVVLRTTAVLLRNFAGLSFVGNDKADAAPSRSLFIDRISALPGFRVQAMRSLPASWRRSLSERAFVSRSYAADPEAPLAVSEVKPLYLLSDDGEHLRFVARLPGFDIARALHLVESCAEDMERNLPPGVVFARDAEFGWICARLEDCGSAISMGATLHLPALVMTGLHERFFKNIMGLGAIVRGLYSSEEETSAGSVFDIMVSGEERIEPQTRQRTQRELLEAFVAAAVRAERRARESLVADNLEAVRDAAGRAFGVLRYAQRVEVGEGLQYLSRLRLAALIGFLHGVKAEDMNQLFEELGSGSLAKDAGLESLGEKGREDVIRARRLRAIIATATIDEGGN